MDKNTDLKVPIFRIGSNEKRKAAIVNAIIRDIKIIADKESEENQNEQRNS